VYTAFYPTADTLEYSGVQLWGWGNGGGLIKPAGNLFDMVIFILNDFF